MKYNTVFIKLPTYGYTVAPPLGMLYLATVLQNNNISVKIIDCDKDKLSYKALQAVLADYAPQNIGLTLYTNRFSETFKFIKNVRAFLPETKIIVGGPHATALPGETFRELQPDVLVKGEAENIIFPLIDALNKSDAARLPSLPGIVFKDNFGNTIETPGVNRVADLNALPIPDWSLIPPNEYPPFMTGMMNKTSAVGNIITSRGCKYNCPFCAGKLVYGSGVRYRSVEHVLAEIKLLTGQYGVKEIMFLDENFINDKQHAFKICQALIDNNIKISWCLPNGIKIEDLDDDLIAIFKKSGCHRLGFGIETLDFAVQKLNRKIIDIEKSRQTVQKLKAAKILTGVFLIIGLPGETKRSIENTYRLLKKFDFDFISPPTVFVPTIGSEYSYKYGLQDTDFTSAKFSYDKGTGQSYCQLSVAEIKKYQRKFIILSILTLLSPTKILKFLPYVKFSNFRNYLSALIGYLRN